MRNQISKGLGLVAAVVLTAETVSGGGAGVDLSKKRKLLYRHKDVPMLFQLPPKDRKLPEGWKKRHWVFQTVEKKRERDLKIIDEWIENIEKNIEGIDKKLKKMFSDPKERAKKKEAFLKKARQSIRLLKAQKQKWKSFYNNVRFVVEDSEDRTTAMVVKCIRIKRDFKLKDSVREQKKKRPAWRAELASWKPKVLVDKKVKPYRKWKGHKLFVETTSKTVKPNSTEHEYYDLIYLYRRILKNGRCYLVEIYAHWREGIGKDKSLVKRFDLLLAGLRF